jgi:hypothetical protein
MHTDSFENTFSPDVPLQPNPGTVIAATGCSVKLIPKIYYGKFRGEIPL